MISGAFRYNQVYLKTAAAPIGAKLNAPEIKGTLKFILSHYRLKPK
jgi:hypothetical protein